LVQGWLRSMGGKKRLATEFRKWRRRVWYGLSVVSSVHFFLSCTETTTLRFMTLLHIGARFLIVCISCGLFRHSSVLNTAWRLNFHIVNKPVAMCGYNNESTILHQHNSFIVIIN
jgi:hypothetical protein